MSKPIRRETIRRETIRHGTIRRRNNSSSKQFVVETIRRNDSSKKIVEKISKKIRQKRVWSSRGVLADFWVPNEIDSWNFQQILFF